MGVLIPFSNLFPGVKPASNRMIFRFSLATGLGGKSLLWVPVATSMVFGLFVAIILTLFLVPVLFRSFMRLRDHRIRNLIARVFRLETP